MVIAVNTTYFIVKIDCACCFDMMGDVCSTCVLPLVCSVKFVKRWLRFPSMILIGQVMFFVIVRARRETKAQQGFASVEEREDEATEVREVEAVSQNQIGSHHML